jgi:hypothetical protein
VHINEINAPKHVDFVFEKTDFQLPNFMENANNTIVPESKSILFIKLKQTATAIQQ